MRELDEKKERRLAELTGLNEAVVVRCKKLLSYPKRYQDMMLDADPERRVKSDFFIELYPVLHDRTVSKFDWFKRNAFTDAMLEKAKAKRLRSVTEFRKVKQHINNAVKSGKTATMSRRLREFMEQPLLTTDHLDIESAKVAAEARKLATAADRLYAQMNDVAIDEFFGEDEMWSKLERLANLIRSKLRDLGRRLDS
jgi:hypothetical protein